MSRNNNEYTARNVVNSAEEIKNIPVMVDVESLINGYVITYQNNQFILKEQSGGGGTGVDNFFELTDTPSSYVGSKGKMVTVNATENALEFTDVPTIDPDAFKAFIYNSILAGSNITIDRSVTGQITINSTGGGGSVAKLSDIGDVPAYSDGVLTYINGQLQWVEATQYKVFVRVAPSAVIIPTVINRAVVVYKNTTVDFIQTLKPEVEVNSIYSFANYGNFTVTIEGYTILNGDSVEFIKTSTGWVKSNGSTNYDSKIQAVIDSIPTKATDLTDFPNYGLANNGNVLTKEGTAMIWKPVSGGGGGDNPVTTIYPHTLYSEANPTKIASVRVLGSSEFCSPFVSEGFDMRATVHTNGNLEVSGAIRYKISNTIAPTGTTKSEAINIRINIPPAPTGFNYAYNRDVQMSPTELCTEINQSTLAQGINGATGSFVTIVCDKRVASTTYWNDLKNTYGVIRYNFYMVAVPIP